MDPAYRKMIATEFLSLVERTIGRMENQATAAPFHNALLPPIGRAWSRFERSFSTSMGQGTWERVSRLAAMSGGASDAGLGHTTTCIVDSGLAEAIETHIQTLRGNSLGRDPNWEKDLAAVRGAATTGRTTEVRVISDLWFQKNGINHYVSIKTVKPNIDQTAEAKRNMLHLATTDPACKVYFALPYNPYGQNRTDYAWSMPFKIFAMHTDPVVLIDRDYWDLLGGPGTMGEMLQIATEIGGITQQLVSSWAVRGDT